MTGMTLRLTPIKKMPMTCFNKVTGLRYNNKWKIRNHVFGLKGFFGIGITIHWDRR